MSHPDLVNLIHREIDRGGGRITFARFMELALHHPRWGYYNKEGISIGGGGDFYTSPSFHPAFGCALQRQLHELWILLGRPGVFPVVEVGAGGGHLARDILRAAGDDAAFSGALHYLIVEQSPRLIARQRERLREATGREPPEKAALEATTGRGEQLSPSRPGSFPRVSWLEGIGQIPRQPVVVLSNELFSAFAVQWVERTEDGLAEVYVTRGPDGGWEEELGPLSDPAILEELAPLNLAEFRRGQRFTVNLQAGAFLEQVARAMDSGYIITIDYGDLAPEVYRRHSRRGSLRCYYRQTRDDNPYQRVGRQDITADLDFSLMMRHGDRVGLRTLGFTEQGRFLLALGLLEEIQELAQRAPRDLGADIELGRILQLVTGTMGEGMKVLVQAKHLPAFRLSGFKSITINAGPVSTDRAGVQRGDRRQTTPGHNRT